MFHAPSPNPLVPPMTRRSTRVTETSLVMLRWRLTTTELAATPSTTTRSPRRGVAQPAEYAEFECSGRFGAEHAHHGVASMLLENWTPTAAVFMEQVECGPQIAGVLHVGSIEEFATSFVA
eukprot:7025224-Prymnesium_polylepis.1